MSFKCPGSQSFSQPHPENIPCPFCKTDVEIWSDEIKATCPSCKKEFLRPMQQSCLEWCKYAKECVGPEAYKKYLDGRKATGQRQRRQKE